MIRVLQSFPRPGRATNPYLTQLVMSLPDDVTTLWWSWRAALFGHYDVLHVHWPELLFRRDGRWRTLARQCLFVLLMLRIAMNRIVLVRTVHNLKPHEPGDRFEDYLLRWCDRRTGLWIALNDSTPIPPGRPSVVIPIGHYRDLYDGMAMPATVSGRLLYFGLVRRYKGVLGLVAAFGGLVSPDLTLRILGRPHPEELGDEIEAACRADPRVSAELRFVEDESLIRDIAQSELVVLPYTKMHNSGAVLLALSLDRPVLAPDTPTTAALAAEVGPAWLLTYRGELDPTNLQAGLGRVRAAQHRSTRPDLTARDWPALGARHREAYMSALRRRANRSVV